MHSLHDFSLWLEFEEYAGGYPQPGDDPACDFCNACATVNGQQYGINIWTFGFVEYARRFDYRTGQAKSPARFMLPPDLLVERLDRPTIECAILELIEQGSIPAHWLTRNIEDETS